MQFHFHTNQSHFHKNGVALRLALKQGAQGNSEMAIEDEITRTDGTILANQNERRHPLIQSKHRAYK